MSVKLIAIGNLLMKDDGIAIEVTKGLEQKLMLIGIEVIYGETNIGYCISKVKPHDYIIVLDAAHYGKLPGEITVLPLQDFVTNSKGYTQHSFTFIDVLKLYYPSINGVVIGIEVKEVDFDIGLSNVLYEKLGYISDCIFTKIEDILIGINTKP